MEPMKPAPSTGVGGGAALVCGLAFALTAAAPTAARAEIRHVWIPNSDQGTVSKIDAQTGAEVARYASLTHDPARVINHVGRAFPTWNAGNFPVATAVDFNDDCWVTNLGPFGPTVQPSLTKIKKSTTGCTDRNGNGLIDTSHEVNGTPGIQLADPAEFLAENDECIVITVVVGALTSGGDHQGLAIDAGPGPGNVWVGIHDEQAFYQIDGITGALLQRVATPGVSPFSAVIDSQGRLWTTHGCCGQARLGRIDTEINPAPFVSFPPGPQGSGSFGIAVDLKDRVWVGGYPYPKASRYDPATNLWIEAQIAGLQLGLGVTGVGIDARGNVWGAVYSDVDGLVARFDADSGASTGLYQLDGPQGSGTRPHGVGVDFDGDVWTVNQGTSNVSRLHIDAATGQPAPHPTSGNIVDVFPVGPGPNTHHSDFTGLGLRLVTRGTTGLLFYTVAPCRAIDTRNAAGPSGGPALVAQQSRNFTVSGLCGIPPTAQAVSLNIAVTGSTAGGHLRLYPALAAVPTISVINYAAGQTRGNNAVGSLNGSGQFALFCGQPTGTVDAIVDVNGYFQ